MPVRAILFDFDGTLANSFGAITSSTNHVRASCGLPALPEADVRSYVGYGLDNLMAELVPTLPVDEAIARYRAHHEAIMFQQTELFPQVRETLEVLHAAGIRMGVCSNKSVQFTRQLVQQLGLSELLPVVLGPEDVSMPKPDPAMLLEGCHRLKVSREETIYVGDMSIDVLAGNAAGMSVYLVNVGLAGRDNPTLAGPSRVLKKFNELREICFSNPAQS